MTFYWPRLQARILLIRQCHFLGVCISDDGIYSLNFCCCYSLLLHGFLPVCSGAKSSFLPSIWPDFLPEQRITGTLGEATTNIPLDPFYASKYVMIAISLGTQTNKVWIPVLLLDLVGNPYQRGFFCDDDSIRHPFHDSTVTNVILYIGGLGLPIVAVSFHNDTPPKQHSDPRDQVCYLGLPLFTPWILAFRWH